MPELNYKEKFPVAFPKLTPHQMAAVAKVAKCITYYNGDVLLGEDSMAVQLVHEYLKKG